MREVIESSKKKMEKVIIAMRDEFASIRAGRANPGVLDKVLVSYYGSPTPINQMAAVAVPEARLLTITPFDPTALKDITKAILASDIGITPTDDGKTIRLVFPQLTEERRREMAKTLKKYGEEAKIAVRNVRRDTIEKFKDMKKKSEITEDDLKDCEKETQDITDKFCKDIDTHVAAKEKEILEV